MDHRKLLVGDEEVCHILSIPDCDLEWLVSTEQLIPICIRGRRLFDMPQIEELVRVYKVVQSRGSNEQAKRQ